MYFTNNKGASFATLVNRIEQPLANTCPIGLEASVKGRMWLLIFYFLISRSTSMKIIKSEHSIDRFNEHGLAEVLNSSLRN